MTFESEKQTNSGLKDLSDLDSIPPIDVEMDEFKRIIITDMSLLRKEYQEFELQLQNSIEKWNEMKPRYV